MASREQLLKLNTFICRLDAYLSLAIAKDSFNLLIAPRFSEMFQDCKVVQGRNLLTEFQQGSFRPIDFAFEKNGVKFFVAEAGSGKTTMIMTLS